MAHTRRRKTFTVQEANAALPLIRAIVHDLVEASRETVDRRERLAYLIGGRRRDVQDPYREELAQIEDELEKQSRVLQEYVQELRDLGVEPKSATEGLIDFPAILDGRQVYLCWKLGEPEVLYWHELDSGFAGRQSLTVDSLADP
ncbi:MAG: DUF2203 domain-containing protein [Rhodopirellula sp.]|nr:DUF2203 domain-containing protein [Rhodopirellula sp.]